MVAVNDATLLLLSIFRVIKLVFKDHPSYMQLQDLFQEVLKLEPCRHLSYIIMVSLPSLSHFFCASQ